MSDTKNILFCGTGGQGVLKASEICAYTALLSGFHVKKTDLHGMAMRGGSVESHLRYGSKVYSPLVLPGELDYLVCFDINEGKKRNNYLKASGFDFSMCLSDDIAHRENRFLNVYILGILSVKLEFALESWYQALKTIVTKNVDENMNAFNHGRESCV